MSTLDLPSVSILIPTYGAGEALRRCLESLVHFAPGNCSIYVLDDGTPDHSVRHLCEQFDAALPHLSYVRSDTHRGCMETCNWACTSVRQRDTDVLLLWPNVEVTAGCVEELQTILYLHERHGVACPRSNEGIFSLSADSPNLEGSDFYSIWQRIKHLLPRYQIMPTAATFCMLIKAEMLKRFDLVDDAYAPEYDEPHDFVCRMNRHGYSALAANWAYVAYHKANPSEPVRPTLLKRQDDLLEWRCPEYERSIINYQKFHKDPLEKFAYLYVPHRARILFDLFHLIPAHTGTSDFGLNLLRELARILENELDLYVGIDPSQRFFSSELSGYRIYDDQAGPHTPFDLVFKPCQVSSWTEFERMARAAPRVTYCMLDVIGVRCSYLNSPARQIVLQKTAELSDCVFTISRFARSDFAAFYRLDETMRVIHLGTNFGMTAAEFRKGEYVLVIGNDFAHKGLHEAVEHLDPALPTVVLGSAGDTSSTHIRWFASGNITRQQIRELFADARVVVYPSRYEGFGLPVVDALALGKPTVVFDTAVNRELDATLCDSNLHRIPSLADLRPTVAKLFEKEPVKPDKEPRRWKDVAEEYAQAFRELLSRDFDLAKVRARWDILRTLGSAPR